MKLQHSFFVAALALMGAAAAQAATFTASFDGFCDGVSITINNGVAHGSETGCVGGPVVGTKGSVKKQGKAYTLSLNHLPNAIYVVDIETPTWTIYAADGSVVQSGTYTVGGAPAAGLKQQPVSGQH